MQVRKKIRSISDMKKSGNCKTMQNEQKKRSTIFKIFNFGYETCQHQINQVRFFVELAIFLSNQQIFVKLANFSRIGKKLNSLFPQLVFHCRELHEATELAPSRDWLSRPLVAEHLLRKLYLKQLLKQRPPDSVGVKTPQQVVWSLNKP